MEKEQLNEVFEEFKGLADRKREVTDQDLESLMSTQRRSADVPVTYGLDHVQVSTGDHGVPTATVSVELPDGSKLSPVPALSTEPLKVKVQFSLLSLSIILALLATMKYI